MFVASMTMFLPILGADSIGIAEAKSRSVHGGGARARSIEAKRPRREALKRSSRAINRGHVSRKHPSARTSHAGAAKYRLGKRGDRRPYFKARVSNKIRSGKRSAQRGGHRFVILGHYSNLSRNRLAFRKSANPRWENYQGYYARVAMKSGGLHFHIPTERYKKMSKGDQWKANRRFLDQQIAKNYRFRLSVRLHQMRPSSIYAQEIAHLRKRGYQVSKDGKWMERTRLNKPRILFR